MPSTNDRRPEEASPSRPPLDPDGEARLLTACLSIPDQQVAARIRAYRLEKKADASVLLTIVEYTEGKNENERNHQQQEQHRTAINRNLKPQVYPHLRNQSPYDMSLSRRDIRQ